MILCTVNEARDLIFITHSFSGHRISWLGTFSLEALAQGRTLHVVCDESSSYHELTKHLSEIQLQSICFHSVSGGKAAVRAETLRMRRTYKQVRVATTDGEEWLPLIIRLHSNLRVLFMRPYLQKVSFSSMLSYLLKFLFVVSFKLVKSSRVGLLRIPLHKTWLFKRNWVDDLYPQVELSTQHQLHSLDTLRSRLSIPSDHKIISVPGYISKRKNPHLIHRSFEMFRNQNPEVKASLIFGGEIDEESKVYFSQADTPDCYFTGNYLTKEEYLSLVSSSDLIILLYDNNASSGIALDCFRFSTPLIMARNAKWEEFRRAGQGSIALTKKKERDVAYLIQIMLKGERKFENRHNVITNNNVSYLMFN
jgi:glycosyltransferase involved in cell wall biosynthesis